MRYLLLLLAILLTGRSNAQSVYLSTIDIAGGTVTRLHKLPGVSNIPSPPRYLHFNSNQKAYVFLGIDASGNTRLYTIDVQSTPILAAPIFPAKNGLEENVSELVHDCNQDSLLAISHNPKTNQYHLVYMDPVSGLYRPIAALPDINAIVFNTGNFNTTTNQYSFVAINNSSQPEYISVTLNDLSVQRLPLPAGNYTNLLNMMRD